mmetsp:Transcript_9652/g.24211  ORF Transcript_9652/g.24211 Transcript_9652/m.24211 type:complete len:408 (-) Transcript_9652:47-1270(-)
MILRPRCDIFFETLFHCSLVALILIPTASSVTPSSPTTSSATPSFAAVNTSTVQFVSKPYPPLSAAPQSLERYYSSEWEAFAEYHSRPVISRSSNSLSSPKPYKLRPLSATVLCGSDSRWDRIREHFCDIGIPTVSRFDPISLDDPRVVASQGIDVRPVLERTLDGRDLVGVEVDATRQKGGGNRLAFVSQFFSHAEMWAKFAASPERDELDWEMFFEDDSTLQEAISPVATKYLVNAAYVLGNASGFIYLGICKSPGKTRLSQPGEGNPVFGGLTFKRVTGSCTHAYALAKWRARTLLREMATSRRAKKIGIHDSVYMDCWLPTFLRGFMPGANLMSHRKTNKGHFGLFIQDREVFKESLSGNWNKNSKEEQRVVKGKPIRNMPQQDVYNVFYQERPKANGPEETE